MDKFSIFSGGKIKVQKLDSIIGKNSRYTLANLIKILEKEPDDSLILASHLHDKIMDHIFFIRAMPTAKDRMGNMTDRVIRMVCGDSAEDTKINVGDLRATIGKMLQIEIAINVAENGNENIVKVYRKFSVHHQISFPKNKIILQASD